jgi:hypothetical protein
MNYRTLRTLGAKSKLFKWIFDPKNGITIRRQFTNGDRVDIFSINEIEQIIQFTIKNGNIPLANSVEKINAGVEKIGLGSFIYNQFTKDINKAQAASQLAAILVKTGIYDYNGLMRNMEFWIKNSDWQPLLLNE